MSDGGANQIHFWLRCDMVGAESDTSIGREAEINPKVT
jgi:hypothetical protein